jgi:hypothetical protein
VSCVPAGTVGVRLSDDDRAIDVFALGEHRCALLGAATAHLAVIVEANYRGLKLCKHALARVTDADRADPTLAEVQHPFLGPCRVDALVTTLPEWLQRNAPSDLQQHQLPPI